MGHPYQELPASAFWRTAVAERDALEISGLWHPKFAITMTDTMVTAGSCFAQHISRAMRSCGFHWMDAEAAPAMLSEESAKRFNYGVFSFRTGNIYTTPLLRQWVRWSLGKETPDDECWEVDGRFYDPLRPQIEPGGFASVDEVLRARGVTLAAIRRALTEADVFVFTLGLTERWSNAETGLIYSNCPGTIGGEFDPDRHVFVNDSYPAVYGAMAEVVELAAAVNPALRFVLTVSPVPITATVSENHVLSASTYTKSTLRAVAGDLESAYENVEYFPSYEMITAPAYRGRFYEPNLRAVSPVGVAHVMEEFFAGLRWAGVDVGMPAAMRDDAEQAPARQDEPAARTGSPEQIDDEQIDDELVCEEEILDFYNVH